MFRTVSVRGLILVLLLVLGTSLAFAAESREPEAPALRGVVSALWEALVEQLLPIFELNGTTGSGSSGTGGTTTSGGSGDGGPVMDPNGKPTGP